MEKEKVSSGNIIDFKVLKRIMQFVKPYMGRFYFVIVLTFLLGILTPIRPLLIQHTLDAHVQYGNYWAMVNVMLIILGLLVVQSVVQYAHTYISGRIAQFIIRDIRIQLYEHLIKLRLRFFDKTPIGRLVTRTISDVETLSDVFSEGLAAMASDLLQIIFILAFMFWIDWKLR
jgi:ATP-binding cassette subfamily B protein